MRSRSVLHRLPIGLGALALASCAGSAAPVIIDGVPTARTTMEFAGNPYSIRHTAAHPRPGSPSSGVKGDGGAIAGTVWMLLPWWWHWRMLGLVWMLPLVAHPPPRPDPPMNRDQQAASGSGIQGGFPTSYSTGCSSRSARFRRRSG